jgi:hypothetical protein
VQQVLVASWCAVNVEQLRKQNRMMQGVCVAFWCACQQARNLAQGAKSLKTKLGHYPHGATLLTAHNKTAAPSAQTATTAPSVEDSWQAL